MYRNLLVPLDGSAMSERALPLAVDIARRADALLRVVRVHTLLAPLSSGIDLVPDFTLDATLREQERTDLEKTVHRLAGQTSVRLASALLEGPVVGALCAHAEATGTDLMVMATHGRGPLSRFWLGSVADKVLRQAPVPVLLVRPPETRPDLGAPPDLGRILIPLDGSELAEHVLEPAVQLGTLVQAEYTLLRVIEPIFFPVFPPSAASDELAAGALRKMYAEAKAYLEQLAGRLRERSLRVQAKVVVNRPAAAAILETARVQSARLIALATHGRGGLARLLVGSVADKVLRGAPTPVLVYRPRGG
jgi:nucleotide-binding universal stress UspA family protein